MIPTKVDGDWLNSAGEEVATIWGVEQPAGTWNGKPENCLQFWGAEHSLGKMNDQYCTDRQINTICQTISL